MKDKGNADMLYLAWHQTLKLQTASNQVPWGSNFDFFLFFFWLGSNTVAKTPW